MQIVHVDKLKKVHGETPEPWVHVNDAASGIDGNDLPMDTDWLDTANEEAEPPATPSKTADQTLSEAEAVEPPGSSAEGGDNSMADSEMKGPAVTVIPIEADERKRTASEAVAGRPRRTVRKPSHLRDFVCTSRRSCRW
jgi:hypothetical protein